MSISVGDEVAWEGNRRTRKVGTVGAVLKVKGSKIEVEWDDGSTTWVSKREVSNVEDL